MASANAGVYFRRGQVFDVAVDIRRGSSTYGQWVGQELSDQNGSILYVPPGFAHGFCVTSKEADVLYKVTAEYAPELERGIIWDDPAIGIKWPIPNPGLSVKDANYRCCEMWRILSAMRLERRMFERFKIDSDAYHRRAQTGPCFICEIVARNPEYPAHIIYEDDVAIAFLDKYPPLYGHTLIAPREHREQVTGDFTLEEYLDLQRRVHCIAEAVRQEVRAERVYLYAFGSNQGIAHVHWHVAPLPPGVPYRQQQLAAIRQDPLRIPEEERASLAARIRRRMEELNGG